MGVMGVACIGGSADQDQLFVKIQRDHRLGAAAVARRIGLKAGAIDHGPFGGKCRQFFGLGAAQQMGDKQAMPCQFGHHAHIKAIGRIGPAEQILHEIIAPLHMRCALASLQRCPHLGGMADRDLKAFPPSWVVVPLYVKATRQITGQPLAAVSFLQLFGITNDHDAGWRDRAPAV